MSTVSRYVSKCPYALTSLYPIITTHNMHIITLCVYIFMYTQTYTRVYIYISTGDPHVDISLYHLYPYMFQRFLYLDLYPPTDIFQLNSISIIFYVFECFNLSIHLSVHPSLYTRIQSSRSIHVFMSMHLFHHLSKYLPIYTYVSIDLSISQSIRQYVHPSGKYLFVHLSIYPPSSIRLI